MKITVKKIKKDEMGWICGMHGVEEIFMKNSGGEHDGEMAWKS
jgi:hypothetical protein